jgi:hypothetical protein
VRDLLVEGERRAQPLALFNAQVGELRVVNGVVGLAEVVETLRMADEVDVGGHDGLFLLLFYSRFFYFLFLPCSVTAL